LGNLIIAINVAVYRTHVETNMKAIPRMERLAAGTLRALCAPARHAFPVPWLIVVIVAIWPVENITKLWYRIRYRANSTVQATDAEYNTSVTVEDNAVIRRKHTSSNWRLAIWWMTLGWFTLLVDLLVRGTEWVHHYMLLPSKPRW
jgi:hypothetical protein